MIFACDRCGRRYSVPDERVQGRAFRVTCKSCGNVIVVKPGAAERTVPAAPQPGPEVRDPFTSPPPPAPPPAAPVPAAAVPAPAAPAAGPPPPRDGAMTTGPSIQVSGLGSAAHVREHDSSRALTAAEMAWMSDDDARRPPPAPAPEPQPDVEEDVNLEDSPPAPPPAERSGPGMARIVAAAVLLGVAAAAVAALFLWPGRRSAPPPPPPASVAAAPAPPPAATPPPGPPPPPPAAPPASALDPASLAEHAPPPALRPAPASLHRVGPGAHFEPGTVKIGSARRKEGHRLNQKDRKLLDLLSRKRDEAAPPEPVEKLDLDSGRSLDQAAVERVIGESQGAFSGCVTRAAKATGLPDARKATLLLTVARSGEVSSAWVAEEDVSRTGLGRCLVGAAHRLVFPAFEGDAVDVSVPLTLEAR